MGQPSSRRARKFSADSGHGAAGTRGAHATVLSRQGGPMRIGASLFLIACGAILTFAVTKEVNGIDLSTIGVILMIVGVLGLLITLILANTRRRTDIIHRRSG